MMNLERKQENRKMKKMLLILSLLTGPVFDVLAYEVKTVSVDTSLTSMVPRQNQIMYGWELMPWNEWLRRPSSGPLMIPGNYNKKSLEVFEAHSSVIVNKPVSSFTKQYLHNINTIRRLDPKNQHEQLPASAFSTVTVVNFPTSWANIIMAARNAKILADDSTPYLRMQSVFAYASKEEINNSVSLRRIIQLLDENNQIPDAVNIQGIVKVNQIAEFGSVVSLFYGIDANRTLIVNYFALALKKRILDLGVVTAGMELNGRSVLLGKNSMFNTDSGIGAGLPTYTLEFFEQMALGL
jgi:hypothetical protein